MALGWRAQLSHIVTQATSWSQLSSFKEDFEHLAGSVYLLLLKIILYTFSAKHLICYQSAVFVLRKNIFLTSRAKGRKGQFFVKRSKTSFLRILVIVNFFSHIFTRKYLLLDPPAKNNSFALPIMQFNIFLLPGNTRLSNQKFTAVCSYC